MPTSFAGIDFKTKKIKVRDKIVQLCIWDSAGNERFRTITESYYRGVSGIVIVYDVCYRNSFEEVENFFVQIRDRAHIRVKVVLVGAKCELGTQDDKHHAAAGYSARAVSYEEGKALADRYGIPFFEASAKENIMVDEIFGAMASDVVRRWEESQREIRRRARERADGKESPTPTQSPQILLSGRTRPTSALRRRFQRWWSTIPEPLYAGPPPRGVDPRAPSVRIVLIGDCSGKSSYLRRLKSNTFAHTFIMSIGVDMWVQNFKIDDQEMRAMIFDTSGTERFRTITTSYFRHASCFMLFYDVNCRRSFENVHRWMREISDAGNEDSPVVLVGQKCDVRQKELKDADKQQTETTDLHGLRTSPPVPPVPPSQQAETDCSGSGNVSTATQTTLWRRVLSWATGSTATGDTSGGGAPAPPPSISSPPPPPMRPRAPEYVSNDEGAAFAAECNMPFVETSAKTGENVQAAFWIAAALGAVSQGVVTDLEADAAVERETGRCILGDGGWGGKFRSRYDVLSFRSSRLHGRPINPIASYFGTSETKEGGGLAADCDNDDADGGSNDCGGGGKDGKTGSPFQDLPTAHTKHGLPQQPPRLEHRKVMVTRPDGRIDLETATTPDPDVPAAAAAAAAAAQPERGGGGGCLIM